VNNDNNKQTFWYMKKTLQINIAVNGQLWHQIVWV